MKGVGFVFAGVGVLAGLVSKVPAVQNVILKMGIVSKESISQWGLYVAIALILIGLLIVFLDTKGKAPKEVPIYRGDKIIGYRRA